MSELDNELRGLREELTSAIPLPDVEQVTGRARTRHRLQVGAIAAVVAVAVAVPVLRELPSSAPPATPPASVQQSFLIDFADPDHGFALGHSCPRPSETCSFGFYRTVDGGRDWQAMTLPPPEDPATGYFSATVYVLGPDEVVIDQPAGMSGHRIRTTDGGRTWRTAERRSESGGATARVGPSDLMTGECGKETYRGEYCDQVGSLRPGFVPTPAQPPLTIEQFGPAATENGRWWAVGRHRTNERFAVSVSADGGATWATSELVGQFVPSAGGWAVVDHNGVMYLTATSNGSLAGVWRSIDDGRSWTATGTYSPFDDDETPRLVGYPVMTSEGSLVLFDGTDTYVSTNQGRGFERAEVDLPGVVTWTRAGYLRAHGNQYALSTDGVRWREFVVR